MKVEHSVTIGKPVEEVFGFLTDVSNLPRWQDGVTEAHPGGTLGVGSRFTQVRSFLGKRIASTQEVIEHEPGRAFAFRVVDGPVPIVVRHTFEADGDSTLVRIEGSGDPGGVFKLAEGLVMRQIEKTLRKDYSALKRLLEAGS